MDGIDRQIISSFKYKSKFSEIAQLEAICYLATRDLNIQDWKKIHTKEYFANRAYMKNDKEKLNYLIKKLQNLGYYKPKQW